MVASTAVVSTGANSASSVVVVVHALLVQIAAVAVQGGAVVGVVHFVHEVSRGAVRVGAGSSGVGL